MSKNNFKIDFIGIGAMKAATTWIYHCLREHPEICFPYKGGPRRKEIHFFSGKHRYRSLEYYKSFFKDCPEEKVKGEISTLALTTPYSAKLIKKHFPGVKIFVCLRNPISRAYSKYTFAQHQSSLLSLYDSFEEAVEKRPELIKENMYYKHLKRYYDLFPRKNILALIFEDIEQDPIEFIRELYSFLGVSNDFIPKSAAEKINPTGQKIQRPKIPIVNKILYKIRAQVDRQSEWGKKIFSFSDATGLYKLIKEGIIRNNTRTYHQKKISKKKPIDAQTRKKLSNIFKSDIKKTEKLIQKNLSHWLE